MHGAAIDARFGLAWRGSRQTLQDDDSLESTIAESDQRLLQLRSSYASDLNQQRLQSVTSINRLQQQFGKLHYQEGLLELRAPRVGVVKELATTTLGAVVQPGTVILSLVPANEPLVDGTDA